MTISHGTQDQPIQEGEEYPHYITDKDNHHIMPTSNLCQPKEGRLGQKKTRSGGLPEQSVPFEHTAKQWRIYFLQFHSKHHITSQLTGRHRLHEEPVSADILDMMSRRDDLHGRDSNRLTWHTKIELLHPNTHLYTSKKHRKKGRDLVENMDQKPNSTTPSCGALCSTHKCRCHLSFKMSMVNTQMAKRF